MQLNDQLLITFGCVNAIGNSLKLEEMIEHFLKVFSRKTGALASLYWEYKPKENEYKQICLYGKQAFEPLFQKPPFSQTHESIFISECNEKSLLHVKVSEDWIVFVFQRNQHNIEFIKAIIYSFLGKLENAIYACKNHLELLEINENLEKKVEEEVQKNRNKDKHILQQSRLAQMGEMISMIAHQWRQPLGSISAVAASVKLKSVLNKFDITTDLGRKEQKEFIADSMGKIESYIQFLTHTIDDFRNFFKPDKQKENTTLVSLVNRTLEIIGKALEINGIIVNVENHTTKELLTYTSEVTQVILNILKNAEDIFKERETKNRQISIVIRLSNGMQYLEIEDNAGGIDETVLPHIFEPYFSTKNEKNGTGLGLYMSKTIIEEHCGGKISAINGVSGAKFIIEFKEI